MTHSIAEEIKSIAKRVSVLENGDETLKKKNYVPPFLDVAGIQKALYNRKRKSNWFCCISEPEVIDADNTIDAIFYCIKNIDDRLSVLEKAYLK